MGRLYRGFVYIHCFDSLRYKDFYESDFKIRLLSCGGNYRDNSGANAAQYRGRFGKYSADGNSSSFYK